MPISNKTRWRVSRAGPPEQYPPGYPVPECLKEGGEFAWAVEVAAVGPDGSRIVWRREQS